MESVSNKEDSAWDTVRRLFFPDGFPTVWEAENFEALMEKHLSKNLESNPEAKAALKHMFAVNLQGQCDPSRKNYSNDEAERRLSILHRKMRILGIPEGGLSAKEYETLITFDKDLKNANSQAFMTYRITSLQNRIAELTRQKMELERELKALQRTKKNK